jgi:hypothetical protein
VGALLIDSTLEEHLSRLITFPSDLADPPLGIYPTDMQDSHNDKDTPRVFTVTL